MRTDEPAKVIRWGILGCGDVAERKSGPALYTTPNSQLVAVMRRDAAMAEEFARRHGAARWYGDVESLLADSEVDAVYIASPHNRHLEHLQQVAASSKKMILCEKPMGTSAAQAQAGADVCRAHGTSLTVAYYRRFWPIVQAMAGLLAEGELGEVVAARVLLLDHTGNGRAWYNTAAASGGGALANGGSHWVDLLRYLLGEIVSVWADMRPSATASEVEETADVHLVSAGGAVASLLTSWRPAVPINELEIIGTAGRMLASPLSEGRLLLQRRGREPEERRYPRAVWMHGDLIAALVPCLLAGQPSPLPGEDAVAVWRIMEAAYRATREGQRQRVV